MFSKLGVHKAQTLGDRILKVNHSGEHGAVNIYAGQLFLARFTAPGICAELRAFQADEIKHRALFQAELAKRNVRRCRSYQLCAAGGFTLGLMTALCGKKAIAATTVAVERVVLQHLEKQIAQLTGQDAAAVTAISAIVDEEKKHHNASKAHLTVSQFWLSTLTAIVALATEGVIFLGMHL